MAKCWSPVLLFYFVCIVLCFSYEFNDGKYYEYNIAGGEPVYPVVVRLQRDVVSQQLLAVTQLPATNEKNELKKNVTEKFPETKKPFKIDKKKTKKPHLVGVPGERPILLPDQSEMLNGNNNDSDTSTTATLDTSPHNDGNYSIATSTTTTTTSTTTTTTTTTEPVPPPPTVDDEAIEDDSPLNISGYKNNNTKTEHHSYYNSHSFSGDQVKDHYWVNLDHLPANFIKESKLLSSAYRQAFTLSLKFEFPFYGHVLQNITIATGGFLYTGDLLHTWLAATQYIAPLMANFDTSASTDSKVKYVENGTSLTVQWENVKLKEKLDGGSFTFQVTIHKNGDIVFSYKDVPVAVDVIADENHPVKVGLSDAYIVHKTIFYVRRKTIYEYHKIDLKKPEKISNWTAIVFKALPTCVSMTDCNSCLVQNTSFQCRWCDKVGRCSDGMDRHRQDWLLSRCDFFNAHHPELCLALPHDRKKEPTLYSLPVTGDDTASSSTGTGVTVAILVCLVLCVISWLTYAYFFPHTTSGQLLIKYRPSRWSFKRGGARYTAAAMHSIHM